MGFDVYGVYWRSSAERRRRKYDSFTGKIQLQNRPTIGTLWRALEQKWPVRVVPVGLKWLGLCLLSQPVNGYGTPRKSLFLGKSALCHWGKKQLKIGFPWKGCRHCISMSTTRISICLQPSGRNSHNIITGRKLPNPGNYELSCYKHPCAGCRVDVRFSTPWVNTEECCCWIIG